MSNINSNNRVNVLSSDTVYDPIKDNDVYFNTKQLKYLQRLFPNVSRPASVTDELLRHFNGQQSVVEAVAARVR